MQWISLRRTICLSFLLASISVGSVSAGTLLESLNFNPYIGWEYQYQHIKGNGPYSQFMPANFQNQAIFLGNKYHKNFGIEIGYYHTLKKSQGSAELTQFWGIPANGSTFVMGQMRNQGFSFEWDVYYPLDKYFNLMGIIGIVTMHPNLEIYTSPNTNLATALRTVYGKNKTILRLGIGGDYEEKHWGARGRIFWDKTQNLYVNVDNVGNVFTTITPEAFKQACTFTVGIYYKF